MRFVLARCARTAFPNRDHRQLDRRQRNVPRECACSCRHRLRRARRAHRRRRAEEGAAAAAAAHERRRPTRRPGRRTTSATTPTGSRYDATVSTDADQLGDHVGLPAAGVGRERPSLLPLQDGRADPQPLGVPVGAVRGEARQVARRRHRDRLPPGARVQRRPDDRRR